MSHTPGPLQVSKHGTPEYSPQYGVYAEGNRNDHAVFTGENAKADATLYAASPELLEALKALCECAELNQDDMEPDTLTLLPTVRAAIAKATT
jgi:hypothetical protein